jgi:hypothetical protein
VQQRRPPGIIVLDMDSSESPTYGEQEGSAYNGHFGCTCYHPLCIARPQGAAQSIPGPNMILMMSFVGWKVWGFPGAVASAFATFGPPLHDVLRGLPSMGSLP